jgi:SSS family solute:Na+ symporter
MFAPEMAEVDVRRLVRISVAVVTVVAFCLSIHSSTTLVGLLLLAYSGVSQFAPGIVLGIFSSRVNAAGVLTGLFAGLSIVGYLIFTQSDPLYGMNAGFIGLVVNVVLVVAVSLMTAPKPNGFDLTPA